MNQYTAEQIDKWKAELGPRLSKTMTERGLATHTYRVASTDGLPLPTEDQALICYCDGWWPANFGGTVHHSRNGIDASVRVFVD